MTRFDASLVKFTPSFDMSKILNSRGEVVLTLESYKYFYDYDLHKQTFIVNLNDVEMIDYSITKYEDEKKPEKGKRVSEDLPNRPSILKLKNGKIAVFIPFTELIYMN